MHFEIWNVCLLTEICPPLQCCRLSSHSCPPPSILISLPLPLWSWSRECPNSGNNKSGLFFWVCLFWKHNFPQHYVSSWYTTQCIAFFYLYCVYQSNSFLFCTEGKLVEKQQQQQRCPEFAPLLAPHPWFFLSVSKSELLISLDHIPICKCSSCKPAPP